jgi:hypothetical protein
LVNCTHFADGLGVKTRILQCQQIRCHTSVLHIHPQAHGCGHLSRLQQRLPILWVVGFQAFDPPLGVVPSAPFNRACSVAGQQALTLAQETGANRHCTNGA